VNDVLLLTSHPLSPPWDSADKQLAVSLTHLLERYRFTVFGRAGHPLDLPTGRRIPIWSRHGRPGFLERAQVALVGLPLELTVDLVHVVLTIGPAFSWLSAFRRWLPTSLRRPLIHTVPGVQDGVDLDESHALGITVALSEATASHLRGVGFSDVRIVPPGIPLERWPFAERPRRNPDLILYAGHYGRDPGAENAIRAVAGATREERPLQLLLAMRTRLGQDPSRESERLWSVARACGFAELEIRGHVADMGSSIRSSSLVVFPDRSLAGKADLPLVLLEAMASGRPVVVSDLPQFSPLGDAVTRVPVGDARALGQAIRFLLDEPACWQQKACAGRVLVQERFSDEVMARRYAELYEEALGMSTYQ
jgi:glycosyltransferase involved in cell wall biosynthesis